MRQIDRVRETEPMKPACDIAALEEVAARAVPPGEVCEIGGWLARFTGDLPARRANSVLARAHAGPDAEATLAAVERFYAERGRPARFQVTPASRPEGLRALLRRRGYALESPTDVWVGALAGAAALRPAPGARVALAPEPGAGWWEAWRTTLGISHERTAGPAALFGRLRLPTAFVAVGLDSTVAAVGMGVCDGRWLGIFNMATRPQLRRCGAGRTVLAALARWASSYGATDAYLQVDVTNHRARALYRLAGLNAAYRYAYLTRELQ